MEDRNIPNTNQIHLYIHCALCLEAWPKDEGPRTWQRLSIGWTKQGLQIWCARHECNIMHIDFQGIQHPANTSSINTGAEIDEKSN